MATNGPILLIEDDEDDQLLIQEILQRLHADNPLRCFTNAGDALKYLSETKDKPFLIISNVHLNMIDGIELRQKIQDDPTLKDKSIPFVFMSTDVRSRTIKNAYNLPVQGYFEKSDTLEKLERTFRIMIDYWTLCIHPNVNDTNLSLP